MGELSLWDAEQLGLAAGDLAIELGIAEQRSTHALVANLRCLTLGEELLITHIAIPAGDLKRDDDPVAHRQIGD